MLTDHRIVAKPDVLARAKRDLAQGHTDLAIRRLRGYLATEPNSLEVRRVLAAIYRQTGNYAEAGRWGYLTADVRPVELTAFERANPSPFVRLRMLNFTADPRHLPPAAQDRLRVLIVQAEVAPGGEVTYGVIGRDGIRAVSAGELADIVPWEKAVQQEK